MCCCFLGVSVVVARDWGGFLGEGGGVSVLGFREAGPGDFRATLRRFGFGSLSEDERVIIVKMSPGVVNRGGSRSLHVAKPPSARVHPFLFTAQVSYARTFFFFLKKPLSYMRFPYKQIPSVFFFLFTAPCVTAENRYADVAVIFDFWERLG